MVPSHSFLRQIYSCMFTVLPANFYDKVKEGSLILKKSHNFSFCQNGLIVDGEATPVATDIVIFGTGYKSDAKLKNISGSTSRNSCLGHQLPCTGIWYIHHSKYNSSMTTSMSTTLIRSIMSDYLLLLYKLNYQFLITTHSQLHKSYDTKVVSKNFLYKITHIAYFLNS